MSNQNPTLTRENTKSQSAAGIVAAWDRRPSLLTTGRIITTGAGVLLVVGKVVPGFAAEFSHAGPVIAWTGAVMIGLVLDAAWVGFGEAAIHAFRAKDRQLAGWFATVAALAVVAATAFMVVVAHSAVVAYIPAVAALFTVGAEVERSRLTDRATRRAAQARVDEAKRRKVAALADTRAAELDEEAKVIEQARMAQVRKAREVAEIEAIGREDRAVRKAKATAHRRGILAGFAYNGAAAKWDASHPATPVTHTPGSHPASAPVNTPAKKAPRAPVAAGQDPASTVRAEQVHTPAPTPSKNVLDFTTRTPGSQALPRPAAKPAGRAPAKKSGSATKTPELVTKACELRDAGGSWSQVAAAISAVAGTEVPQGTVRTWVTNAAKSESETRPAAASASESA